jgi:DNA modification methylase
MKHPATYTDAFFPVFAKLLNGKSIVLDPFAGTGKLALIKNFGFDGEVWCNELEPEWVKTSTHKVDKWNVGDARNLSWAAGVDAICTSPTYGNRMADSHNAKDASRRITYTHYIGRKLTDGNSGAMQWGEKYRNLHEEVWSECWKTLASNGLMIVNVSNHIRKGCEIDVVFWHEECLRKIGFDFVDHIKIQTPRMKFGQNSEKRISHESILVFKKPSSTETEAA